MFNVLINFNYIILLDNKKTLLPNKNKVKNGLLSSDLNIKTLNTSIRIKPNNCNGFVTQDVEYELKKDKFVSVIQKVSLESSSDMAVNFKVTSK